MNFAEVKQHHRIAWKFCVIKSACAWAVVWCVAGIYIFYFPTTNENIALFREKKLFLLFYYITTVYIFHSLLYINIFSNRQKRQSIIGSERWKTQRPRILSGGRGVIILLLFICFIFEENLYSVKNRWLLFIYAFLLVFFILSRINAPVFRLSFPEKIIRKTKKKHFIVFSAFTKFAANAKNCVSSTFLCVCVCAMHFKCILYIYHDETVVTLKKCTNVRLFD